jgi:GR25 family glycosyltransferase involved in LPS biosynthesis
MKPYDYFDRIVCVTLREDVERQHRFRGVMRDVGIGHRFSFFKADRHPKGGRVGCFESHIEVIAAAYADPACKSILIFEDDAIMAPGYDARIIEGAVSFLRSIDGNNDDDDRHKANGRTPWAVMMLGFAVFKAQYHLGMVTAPMVAPHVIRYPWVVLAHAYALSRKGMQAVLQPALAELAKPPHKVAHFDTFMAKALAPLDATYSIVPTQFEQAWCMPSNNVPFSTMEATWRHLMCAGEMTHAISAMSHVREHQFLYALFMTSAVYLVLLLPCLLALRFLRYMHRCFSSRMTR